MKPAYQDNLSTLYITEAIEGAKLLEPQSIHTICTSPPYFGLRSYLDKDHPDKGRELGTESSPDEFVAKLVAVFEALRPALRDDGTLWVNLGQSYAASGGDLNKRKPGASNTGQQKYIDENANKGGNRTPPKGYKPKDLIPTAWLFGIAMQRAGWYLRSDIIWAKGNPMPSSVTDRPSTSHEYILVFSKKPRYFYDAEAVKEKTAENSGWVKQRANGFDTWAYNNTEERRAASGQRESQLEASTFGNAGSRNLRTVWNINSTPYKGQHFATWPIALPDRIIRAATSERGVCDCCGAPFKRVVERTEKPETNGKGSRFDRGKTGGRDGGDRTQPGERFTKKTSGWEPQCFCFAASVPATVLDPFCGSGTTLLAARKLGRRSVGFDLDENSARHVGERLGYQEVLL